MTPKHYSKECGCKYTEGDPYPWQICPEHFAKGLRLNNPKNSLVIKPVTGSYVKANILTVDINIQSNIPIRPNDIKKQYWLYALRLRNDKYYVGMTAKKDPYYRIKAHGGYLGARWTMKHLPIEVIEIRDIGVTTKTIAEDMEQKLVLAYMYIYGHKNVRGGSVIYTGRIFKLGNFFVNDYQIETLFVGLLLVVIGLYLVFTHD